MNTSPRPPRALPKARKPEPHTKGRVMYADPLCVNPFAGMRQDRNDFYCRPVLVLPMPSSQSAKKRLAWERLGPAAKRKVIEDLFPSNWCDAVLTGPSAALRGTGPWGCPDIERMIAAIRADVTLRLLALTGESP